MPLDKLPRDILMVIADFLPTDSVASLTLSNKNLWATIGTQSWKELSNWQQSRGSADAYRLRQDRVALLTSLQLDLADLIYCHKCEKLCHRDGHNPSNRSHPCIQATGIMDLVYAQGNPEMGDPEKVFSLAFLDLQLLMSRYRSLRRESSQQHRLSDPRATELLNNLCMVSYLGVEDTGRCMTSAKVVGDELIIKLETQIGIAGPEEIEQIQMHLPQTCQHVQTRGDIFWPSKIDWWSQPNWQDTLVYQSHVGIPYRCACCHTEYLAEVKKESKTENYLVEVSVWKNLGSFKSHDDGKWQGHLSRGELEERLTEGHCHGIIRHVYESADEEDPLNERPGWMSNLPLRSLLPSHYFDSTLARNS